MFDQFNNGQPSNMAFQPQNDYQLGQYGQQAFNNFQEPNGLPQMSMGGQQAAFYNRQQYPEETTSDMEYRPRSESDDISRDDQEEQQEDQPQQQQQQQYQNYQAYNDQPAVPQTQEQTLFIFYCDKPTKKTNYIISLGSFFGASSNLFCGKIALFFAEE